MDSGFSDAAINIRLRQKKVSEFMYKLDEGEFVEEASTLNEAIHQLVIGQHQSLLVVRNDEITGLLRLTDIFSEVSNRVKACEL